MDLNRKGFTKAVNRAGTSILQSAGAIEKTTDREFEEEERRFRSLEAKVTRLHKEAKGYLDALRAMSLAQTRMGATIEGYYDMSSPLQACATSYKTTIEQIDEELRNNTGVWVSHPRFLDPRSADCPLLPDYNEAIKKRNNKLLDYDAVRSKHRKMVEKPLDDPTRLPRAEDEVVEAKRVYESLNTPLKEELPQLIGLRVPYLEPSFEALLKIQYAHCREAVDRLAAIQPAFQAAGLDAKSPEAADRMLEGAVEDVLAHMRELSICAP
ncbi:hypothetical protein AMAG_00369 [Allomyces macrogynus ATCC 38327]|uniref:BAR domain-containing protein n=1 Tax=Allomyces macrogynus (strain ATCC 38327) TaxID=578462 RepID=A0A0L0RWB8_ALLM3|nr:hypothetical protein AMAG_00369 [Allomyces macrogynus ATCC 38327]|eukprot:KNE54395.1 hypothetical protein AMAG_00369 [Allomyces macrogynus ATCC 38327]